MTGLGEMSEHPVVLAQFGDTWRLGVQTAAAVDGLVADFVSISPNTLSGSVFFVASGKIQPLNVPLAGALGFLETCDAGGDSLFSKLAAAGPGHNRPGSHEWLRL
jgi:hypothetical protein